MKKSPVVPVKKGKASTVQKQAPAPHRILVVDDDGDIRRLNTDVLTRSGYHVDAVEDGAVAWDTLQAKKYDLLVTDNEMPKVTGVELLKKLHAARMALPVIMATGALPKEEFTQHPHIHPAAMLLKPYTPDRLLGTVREILRTAADNHGQEAPPTNRQNPPATDGWQV